MERNAILAAAISIAILLVYYDIILPRFYPAPPKGAAPAGQGSDQAGQPDALDTNPPGPLETEPAVQPEPAVANATDVTVDTDYYTAVFTTAGGRLRSLVLKNFPSTAQPGSPPLEMVHPGVGDTLPLGLELRDKSATLAKDAGVLYELRGSSLQLTGEQEGSLTLVWRGDGILVEKRLRFKGNSYPFFLDVVPQQAPPGLAEISLNWIKGIPPEEDNSKSRVPHGVIAYINNKLVHKTFTELEKPENLTGPIGWSGYASTYFLSAVIPVNDAESRIWLHFHEHTAETRLLARTHEDQPVAFELYLGPKETRDLESAGHNLQKAVDYGYFTFIAVPMLQGLRFLHYVTGNWGVAIILLTMAIKILFIPLTQKSFQSMREMQKLQPQMQKLREQLKDNPEQMNKEIMELYRRHKVNPLSGCLPMVLQIPVFLGLYNALLNAIELRHAPFMLWITDLSSPDRLGSLQHPFVEPAGIPVLTVIMGASMLVQQWMTPAAGDPTQQRMMMIMPLIFTFMFINFPSGLVLYWLVNNCLTIAQQFVMLRRAEK